MKQRPSIEIPSRP